MKEEIDIDAVLEEDREKFGYYIKRAKELAEYFAKNDFLKNGKFIEIIDHFIATNIKMGFLKVADLKDRNENILYILGIINTLEKIHDKFYKK